MNSIPPRKNQEAIITMPAQMLEEINLQSGGRLMPSEGESGSAHSKISSGAMRGRTEADRFNCSRNSDNYDQTVTLLVIQST